MPSVSIIICTRNRAAALQKTVRSVTDAAIPFGYQVELIVVDNASSDATREVVATAFSSTIAVRYIREARPGKGYAYNSALAAAAGEVLLFTDDDVRVPVEWVGRMSAPLVAEVADAVGGGIVLARHLRRPWMTALHRAALAEADAWPPGVVRTLVGANMAVHRRVLDRVPAFDPEVGPGASGIGDDTLFSLQLLSANYRIGFVHDSVVEHHCDPARLTRAAFLDMAVKWGRTAAWRTHHWDHGRIRWPWLRAQWMRLKVLGIRARSSDTDSPLEADEWKAVEMFHLFNHYRFQRRRPPLYRRHGLQRFVPEPPPNGSCNTALSSCSSVTQHSVTTAPSEAEKE